VVGEELGVAADAVQGRDAFRAAGASDLPDLLTHGVAESAGQEKAKENEETETGSARWANHELTRSLWRYSA
jgi:hypothetical protein